MSALLRIGGALLLALAGAPAAAAQDAEAAGSPEVDDLRELLRRDRETLHPSRTPATVVGLDQGADGFRARTPALLNGELEPALVDVDENHRRRLAMYEEGLVASLPLPKTLVPGADLTAAAPAKQPHAASKAPEGSARWLVPTLAASVTTLTLLLLLLRRRVLRRLRLGL